MRILFVVDGRSPIALNWIGHFVERGAEVHLVSTFPCEPTLQLASFQVVPVAFSEAKGAAFRSPAKSHPQKKSLFWSARLVGFRTTIRQWLGFLTFPGAASQLAQVIRQVQPDLIHAMRIPYEGMLTALALEKLPSPRPSLLVSIWGNDFTLHAAANPWMGAFTRRVLRSTAALHTDCFRDQRLAFQWGFDPAKPAIVLPGGGGIQMDLFCPPTEPPVNPPAVINPRGVRAYVRNDTFFRSIPLVLQQFPKARFLCTTMAGDPQAARWLDELGIASSVDLLPRQTRAEMAALFRRSLVVVSPSFHDGTPNTLLEGMACGCYPIAGDIESLREWITPGENGELFDPGNPQALAQAVCLALGNPELRQKAAEHNRRLIFERAEYTHVMQQAESFYQRIRG
jgi:glycosyltransferase involved in cell wall biosynthesis